MTIEYEIGPKGIRLSQKNKLFFQYTYGFRKNPYSLIDRVSLSVELPESKEFTLKDKKKFNLGYRENLTIQLMEKFSNKTLTSFDIVDIYRKGNGAKIQLPGENSGEGHLTAGEQLFLGVDGNVVHDRKKALVIVTGA